MNATSREAGGIFVPIFGRMSNCAGANKTGGTQRCVLFLYLFRRRTGVKQPEIPRLTRVKEE